jgi:predicted MFS family arabinose efflux permease
VDADVIKAHFTNPSIVAILEVMDRIPRDLRALVAFAFTASAADAMLVTLLPSIRREFGLGGVEVGAVLSATTLGMLAVAVPVGAVASRVGSVPLVRVAGAVLPLALLGIALAPGLHLLLAARGAFGLSYGILWVIGPARLASGGRGARGTGLMIGASGAGWLIGPLVAGAIGDVAGWRWPVVALAVIAVPVAILLARDRTPTSPPQPVRARDAVGLVRRERAVAGALAVSAVLGVVSGTASILVPEALSENGFSSGGIGVVLALSAALWTLTGPLSGRAGAGGVDLRLAGAAVGVLGVAFVVPAVSLSTGALVFFVLLSAACRAAVNTLAYALGAGAPGGESGATAVIALMNIVWAVTALVSPLAVGAVDSDGAVRLAFAVPALLGLVTAAWMLFARRAVVAAA